MRDGLRPDEHHEAGSSPQRDDEGAEHRQRHEVGKDSAAAVSARTAAQSGRQVAWLRVGQRHAPATVKHLQRTGTTAVGWRLKPHKEESECVSLTVFLPEPVEETHPAKHGDT